MTGSLIFGGAGARKNDSRAGGLCAREFFCMQKFFDVKDLEPDDG
jgi:hypothetical protein